MITTLTAVGDRLALVLNPETLAELGIGVGTPLEVTAEDGVLHVRPMGDRAQPRFVESAKRMMEIHHELFRKLAE